MNTLTNTTEKRAACYKNKSDIWKSIKVFLFFVAFTLVILPLIGEHGHKAKDPYRLAIESGHFEPVVYDSKISNVRKIHDGIQFDIHIKKPKIKEYCEFIDVQAVKDNKAYDVMWESNSYTKVAGSYHMQNWEIKGLDDLEGVSLSGQHRCHPDYLTVTPLYPFSYSAKEFYSIINERLTK